MDSIDMLLPRIEEHCRATGTAESTFGRIAVNDGKLVSRRRAGGSITLKTLRRIEDVLSGARRRGQSADRTVGLRIRYRREGIGLSRAGLAAMLGLSQSRLQDFEDGVMRVGAARLCAIAQALDTPISFFFAEPPSGEPPRPRPRRPGHALPAAPDAAELLSAYARIRTSQLRHAVLVVALHLARDVELRECRSPEDRQSARPRSDARRAH